MARSALAAIALVVAAIVLATAQARGFFYTDEDLASEDSMWALYERWATHHKVVREHGEMTRRFPTFKNNARWIRDRNHGDARKRNQGHAHRKHGLNIFDDMTDEEIREFTNCNCDFGDLTP